MSILQTKWDRTWSIVERAGARGKVRKEAKAVPSPGVDEKAFLREQNYIWLTSIQNLSDKQQPLFDAACDLQFQTGQAWAYREMGLF